MTVSLSLSGSSTKRTSAALSSPPEKIAPINRDAVIEKLIKDGKLSQNSSQDQITAALKQYIGGSGSSKQETKYSKMKESINEKKIEQGLSNAEYKGVKLGQGKSNTIEKAASIPYSTPSKTVKVLVLLAQFQDIKHNTIPLPDLTRQYWTKDFNVDHYQQLLFGDGFYTTPEGTKSPTFKEYFKEQSNGNLDIEGNVFGWYDVSKEAKYYGQDSDTSNNIHAKDFVLEAAKQAVANGVDLSDYDIEDPYDLDKDGITDEPDGIVDHLMVIYAGMGQEEDGGVLGDDAIWSHSSSVDVDPVMIDTEKNMSILDYTVEAEDGAVGVFAHEFTHDLGMPDDYDTQYTADGDIVEYWSIMGSGSWSGSPAGTMPSGENPYSRIMLGFIHGGNWINWGSADYNTMGSGSLKLDTATMNTGNLQALLINLPEESNTLVMNKPAGGVKEFYGGTGSMIDNSMTTVLDLTGKKNTTLSYDIWYNIEEDWDGGFVQVSEDGNSWTSLATPHTASGFNNLEGYQPILDNLPGYTGSSNGWLNESIDLSKYADKKISLRFRYATDWGTELEGMFVDNVSVVADGEAVLSENAENGFGAFETDGWETSDGTRNAPHYYVAEWRSHFGVDEGLLYNARAKVQYNQGMLLWYVNTLYNDNWVGVHPGRGQIGVVDSTQYVYLNAGIGNGNENGIRTGYMPFVQLHDAAFSNDKAGDMDLSVYSWAQNPNLKGKQAQPLFDDSNSYLNIKSPYSGLFLPKLGLKIRVTGQASDYSRGQISISK
jgi:M6 family metalloprotease domain